MMTKSSLTERQVIYFDLAAIVGSYGSVGVCHSRGDKPCCCGLCGGVSKITPTLLLNIPFNLAQTWTMDLVCSWTNVGGLEVMVLADI